MKSNSDSSALQSAQSRELINPELTLTIEITEKTTSSCLDRTTNASRMNVRAFCGEIEWSSFHTNYELKEKTVREIYSVFTTRFCACSLRICKSAGYVSVDSAKGKEAVHELTKIFAKPENWTEQGFTDISPLVKVTVLDSDDVFEISYGDESEEAWAKAPLYIRAEVRQ